MFTADNDETKLVFRDFAVRVKVNGESVRLYRPEYDEEAKTVTAWIASEAGKEYSISFRRMKDVESDISGQLYLDGNNEPRTAKGLRRDDPLGKWRDLEGQHVDGSSRRRFIFRKLVPTDNHDLLDSGVVNDPGRIELRIQRVLIGQTHLGPTRRPQTTSASIYVHEKDKKLGCHITDLGTAYQRPARRCLWATRHSQSDGDYYVKFVFKHRSPEILQALSIIRQKESKVHQRDDLEDSSKKEDYRDSDIEQDEAEIKALQITLQSRKKALSHKRKVKQGEAEDGPSASRRQRFKKDHTPVALSGGPAEIIDLTSD